jgi:LCCL domain
MDLRYVGAQQVQYQPWVIGGSKDKGDAPIYRGDSFVCAAAIHAGVIKNRQGGCGILSLVGEQTSFSGSLANDISSVSFDSSFPMAYTIKPLDEKKSQCYSPKWSTLVASVLLTVVISLFTTSPEIFFFSTVLIVFFQVGLVSDHPEFEEYTSVVQSAFSRFLPAAFISLVLFRFCATKTLKGLEAQIEKTILWLGGCWFGALENYTLDRLPLQRLTPGDFSQPGAVIVFLVFAGLLLLAVVTQTWAFWKEGRMYRYLLFYFILAIVLSIFATLPGLHLRIHHYVLALILLPGTAIQTRPSLIFQGFLIGLFLNGVARWGFASILETDRSLADGGPIGSILPNIMSVIPLTQGSVINFTFPIVNNNWDGIFMKVNDVERARWPKGAGVPELSYTKIKDEPLYFRFGFFRMELIDGLLHGDLTPPGLWERDGTWKFPPALPRA